MLALSLVVSVKIIAAAPARGLRQTAAAAGTPSLDLNH